MDGATLRLLDELRLASDHPTPPAHAVEAFMCLLGSGRPAVPHEAAAIADLAAAELLPRAEVFRIAYQTASHGEAVPPVPRIIALEGLMSLPVLERAAVALSCVLGFTDGEVGHVLDLDADGAAALTEAGIAILRGGPAEVAQTGGAVA